MSLAIVGANGQVVSTSIASRGIDGYTASSLTAPLGGKMPFGMWSMPVTADVSFTSIENIAGT